jgi:hypothetical protein
MLAGGVRPTQRPMFHRVDRSQSRNGDGLSTASLGQNTIHRGEQAESSREPLFGMPQRYFAGSASRTMKVFVRVTPIAALLTT